MLIAGINVNIYLEGSMRNILKDIQIRKELIRYKLFKNNYKFSQKELIEKDGKKYLGDICVQDDESNQCVNEGDTFINVGYKLSGALPKVLSNLFPYEFYFRGFKLSSVESFFQGIKFRNRKTQKLVFSYSGVNAYRIKVAQDYDWKANQTIYFMGKGYERNSQAYKDLVDELYVSLLQNPLYINALKNVGDKYILHSMGVTDPRETVFTRYEFEKQLNCLKEYCIKYK